MNRAQRRAAWRSNHREVTLKAAAPPVAPVHAGTHGPVSVHVGALVVRGFDRRASAQIAASFERQLGELLRTGTLPARWRFNSDTATFRAAPLRLTPRGPHALGESLAQAVLAARPDLRQPGSKR
jgi:hypothetical protein